MAQQKPVGIGIAGCGNIAGPYGQSILTHPDKLKLVGAYDLDPKRTDEFTGKFGGRVFRGLDEMLRSPEIELVVNLTIHTAHYDVTKQALDAGKHVHSEKPLAGTRQQGAELVELARRRGVLLGCSPFVILGEAQQTAWKAIRDGLAGDILDVTAYMMHWRIEMWHPNPEPFYSKGVGPMLDVGCYPLNVLTSILGPVASVRGDGGIRIPERVIASGPKQGERFRVTAPDHTTGLLRFASGVGGTLTASFVVGKSNHVGIEFYGTKGTLWLTSPVGFDSAIKWCPIEKRGEWEDLPLLGSPFRGVEWSRGPLDMAEAIRTGRQPRCTGEQANHILDVCLSILEAAESGREVAVRTRFRTPEPVY